jgi:hypothetical protein
MRRVLALAASLIAGATAGGVLMLASQNVSSVKQPGPTPTTHEPSRITAAEPTTPAALSVEVQPAPPSDQVVLAWTPGGLPEGLADRVAALPGVKAVTSVRSDLVHLIESRDAAGNLIDQPTGGLVIPMEVMAFDPATYPAFVPKQYSAEFRNLAPGEIALGATSARLRRLGPGGILQFEDGSRFTVAAIVDDVLIGAAEAALPLTEAKATGIATERYLLIRYSGSRKNLESTIRAELPEGVPVRIRAPGETPVLRQGDAVLPPVLIKERFGEFAYRPLDGLGLDLEPGWVEANIVTSEIPLLGIVTCHRAFLPALAGAMREMQERNLAFLIDPAGFRGCWNPRYIAGGKGISRHAWGAAVDLNMGANPQGLESAQDPRLLEVMERWGFTSGHEWLIPDPGHFEYVQPPHGD